MIKFPAILVSSLVFGFSSMAFAADKTPTNATAASVGAGASKPTHAEHEAAEDSVKAKAKAAEAECKKLSGAQRSACKKDAEEKEKTSEANIKANSE